MSEKDKNTEAETTQDQDEHEVLKTFDMYTFFSRKDVMAAIILIVALLIYVIAKTYFGPDLV